MLPDVERTAVTWLRTRTDVTALLGQRIATEVPANPTFPLVRLTRVGGVAPVLDHLDAGRLQVDVWGDTKQQARDAAATVLSALITDLPGTTVDGVVVTGVVQDLGFTWQPDPDTDRPRYLFGVAVFAHRSIA